MPNALAMVWLTKKPIFLWLALSTHAICLYAQPNHTTFACYYGENAGTGDLLCKGEQEFSLADNKSAQEILLKVLTPVGLRPNFVLQPCQGINNCVASIGTDGLRYIIYDDDFMRQLAKGSKTNWPSLSIFAHEVLHHLNQHTHIKASITKRRELELEADEWSGRICALLGATLAEAQAAMNSISHPADDTFSDHPTKDKRLAAIEKGFAAAQIAKPEPKVKLTLSDLSMSKTELLKLRTLDSLTTFVNKGMAVRQIQYIDEEWYVFFSHLEKPVAQTFAVEKNFPYNKTIKQKKEQRQIRSVDYVNGSWVVVYEPAEGLWQQGIDEYNYFSPTMADSLFALGLSITDLALGQNKWLVITDSVTRTNTTHQVVFFASTIAYDKVTLLQRDGYTIMANKFTDGKWLTVLQKTNSKIPKVIQAKGRKTTFPFDEIIRYDAENYALFSAVYDGSNWVYIMNKDK